MTLVVDERASLQGRPGLHALIAGVSAYRHLPGGSGRPAPDSFGLRQLGSTALAAYQVYRWLERRRDHFPVPLATCRLLLSPSAVEAGKEPGLANLAEPCTLDNLLTEASGWRDDASGHPENVTFFYFAGHGVQRSKDDAVMLLEDFASGVGGTLRNAVDANSLFYGMAPSAARSAMARTQLYVVDACRNLPSQFKDFERMEATPVFDVELDYPDDRRAPMFFAAVPGTTAAGIRGEQTLFSKALIECLDGAAGMPDDDDPDRWCVTVHSLTRALESSLDRLNQQYGAQQEFTIGGQARDAIIHYLDGPPAVDVLVEVDPSAAVTCTLIELRDAQDRAVQALPAPLHPHPYRLSLPAGTYGVRARIQPPNPSYADYTRFDQVMPPNRTWKVRVAG